MDRTRSLPKGEAFDQAYREGTVVNGPLLVVRWRANHAGRTRWGFAVGKRLEKRATGRNLVKRRLKEAARQLPVREGYDIVVTARGRGMHAPFAELRAALARQLRKAGLLEDGA